MNSNLGKDMYFEKEELIRYSRHFPLPEVGIEGQKRIKASKVLIIGIGGLGSPASLYLAAAGVGTIGLVDFDVVEESNLQRQILFGVNQKNKSKLDSAVERLKNLNPHTNYKLHKVALSSDNALDIIKNYDIVIDGTDNFPTRYLVNDACVFLSKPNVYGSIYRFEGQMSIFNYNQGPCYRCLYPEPPPLGSVPSCAEGGVLGVLPGIIGAFQANEALKIILDIGDLMINRLLLFDSLSMEFNELSIVKDDNCILCGSNPSITEFIDYKEFCGSTNNEHNSLGIDEISVYELESIIRNSEETIILDVREKYEVEIAKIEGTVHIPMKEVECRLNELDGNKEIVVHCKSGVRSANICRLLLKYKYKSVKNLKGGILEWAKKIDTKIAQY